MKHLIRFGAAICAGAAMASAAGAPAAQLWERWLAHDPASETRVDHSLWSDFLAKYLSKKDGITRVDYAAVDVQDRELLQDYLNSLSATAVDSLARPEQLAFWINLYNALTVETILKHYPVDSIREISSGFFSSGPWGEKMIDIADEKLSLDDIEHRILRPIWKDARLHYAVNCASIGCPNLAGEAFTAANTERLLEQGAHEYVNHPRAVEVRDGSLVVSSIYKWFGEDFGGSDQAIIEHLRQHAGEQLRTDLAGFDSIAADHYDWALNRP